MDLDTDDINTLVAAVFMIVIFGLAFKAVWQATSSPKQQPTKEKNHDH